MTGFAYGSEVPTGSAHGAGSRAGRARGGPTPARGRRGPDGWTLKTSLFFGFFVRFEFIQSLRNLWFWLEI